jgi:hypothetical protein
MAKFIALLSHDEQAFLRQFVLATMRKLEPLIFASEYFDLLRADNLESARQFMQDFALDYLAVYENFHSGLIDLGGGRAQRGAISLKFPHPLTIFEDWFGYFTPIIGHGRLLRMYIQSNELDLEACAMFCDVIADCNHKIVQKLIEIQQVLAEV